MLSIILANYLSYTSNSGFSFILRPLAEDISEQFRQYTELKRRVLSEQLLRSCEEVSFSIEDCNSAVNDQKDVQNYFSCICMLDDKIVGSLMFSRYSFDRLAHSGEFGVTVMPDFQGHGLGTAMINQMVLWAKKTGLERIDLKVHDDNLGAIKLYERLGFVQYGLLPTMLKYKSGKYVGVVHMAKNLSCEVTNG